MQIIKCDICKKTIVEDSKRVHISIGRSILSSHTEICLNCGKSVLKLLKDRKLIKD